MSDDLALTAADLLESPSDLPDPTQGDLDESVPVVELHDEPAAQVDVDVDDLVYGTEQSQAVAILQDRLCELDYRFAAAEDAEPAGTYGDATDAAVRRVQRGLGFRVDRPGQSRVTREQAERIFLNTIYRPV